MNTSDYIAKHELTGPERKRVLDAAERGKIKVYRRSLKVECFKKSDIENYFRRTRGRVGRPKES